jgi:hypothetical protein
MIAKISFMVQYLSLSIGLTPGQKKKKQHPRVALLLLLFGH